MSCWFAVGVKGFNTGLALGGSDVARKERQGLTLPPGKFQVFESGNEVGQLIATAST
jgi:hypothetical protein